MPTVPDADFGWAWYVPASSAFARGGGGGGGVGGGGGYDTTPPESSYVTPPKPHEEFRMSGDVNCAVSVDGFDVAVADLTFGSSIARELLLQAKRNTVNFVLMRTNVGARIFPRYDPNTNSLHWDPFSAATVQDGSGATAGIAPPLLVLAHELFHAANPGAGEAAANSSQNQIAAQLNTTFQQIGWNLPTNRGSESGEFFNVDGAEATTPTIRRPDFDCP